MRPVRPSDALELEYRRTMTPMIRAMAREIHTDVMAVYRPWLKMQRAQVTGDAGIVSLLMNVFGRLRDRWSARAGKHAETTAPAFVEKVDSAVDFSFTRLVRSIGVKEDDLPERPKRLAGKDHETALDAAVAENVGLIKSIPQEYLDQVQRDVLQAVQDGWPLDRLSESLQHRYGITKRRAELIARDQCSKITGNMNAKRMSSAGFVEADWWHSAGSRYPRKSHMAANGRRFKISDGCLIDDEHILPGQKINCKCFMTPVIPGR